MKKTAKSSAPAPRGPAVARLLEVMARLRAPDGCPWDREQTHQTLRYHAVEEVYELMDAIEAKDDVEMVEELGDLLLQVVFHCQLGAERGAFDFQQVARRLTDKLIHRHPHVFGDATARDVEAVWAQWELLKRAEKEGTRHARPSALDGVPRRLPALMSAQKLLKKAAKAGLADLKPARKGGRAGSPGKESAGDALYDLAVLCQENGWSAEDLLRARLGKQERAWRKAEKARAAAAPKAPPL